MNREIKFRVWDKRNKEWANDAYLSSCGSLYFEGAAYNPDDFIVSQYTGIKDRNGKEIYEDDIISGTSHFSSGHKLATNKEVYFSAGGFYICVDDENHHSLLVSDFFQRKISGNVYENPEILESE